MTASCETEVAENSNEKPSWFKRMFQRRRNPSKIPQRRDTLRLNLEEIEPVDIAVAFDRGKALRTIIHDLSAGGVSLYDDHLLELEEGETVGIAFHLPLGKQATVHAQALLVSAQKTGAHLPRVYRFEFVESMSEVGRNLIHRYIVKKQLELMKRQAPPETSLSKG